MNYTQRLEKQIQNLQAKLKAAENLIDNHPFLKLNIGSDDTGLKQTLMQNLKDVTIVNIENNMSNVGDINEIRIKYVNKNQPNWTGTPHIIFNNGKWV